MSDYLAEVPLFKTLPAAERQALSSQCEILKFNKGDVVFEEGDAANFVWVIKRGLVYLTKHTPNSQPLTIFAMTPDEAVCGVSAFENGTYSAGAIAATEAQIVKIPAEAFAKQMKNYSSFARAVLLCCCQRVREMAEVLSIAQAPVDRRLASALNRLYHAFNGTIPITHHELARMAGIRWETSIRTLSDLRRRRWIDSGRGRITILEPKALEDFVAHGKYVS